MTITESIVSPSGEWPAGIDHQVLELLRQARSEFQTKRREHKLEIKKCNEAQATLEISKTHAQKHLSSINSTIKDINTKIRYELNKLEEDD